MTTADTTSAFPSLRTEELPATKSQMQAAAAAADTQDILMQDQLSVQAHLVQRQGQLVRSSPPVCEWVPTNLRLSPQDAQQQNDTYLCLPVRLSEASYFKQHEEEEESKDDGYSSTIATKLRLKALDRYLASVAPLSLSTRRLLFGAGATSSPQETRSKSQGHSASSLNLITPLKNNNNHHHQNRRSKYDRQFQLPIHHQLSPSNPNHHRLITSTNSGRVINVLQGEIAHCTPSQADILVSDDATTCHIVALRSFHVDSKGEKTTGSDSSTVLATMTHIDGTGYEASIRDAVNEHIKYHSIETLGENEESKESCCHVENASNGAIELSIHIMGGFNDCDGSSIEITDNVLMTFAALSSDYNDLAMSRGLTPMNMTVETCAVSSANDDGTGCPIGRGLAMEVATGNVFLAEVEEDKMQEPRLSPALSAMVASSIRTGMVSFEGHVHLLNNANMRTAPGSALGPASVLRGTRLWASAFHPRHRTPGNQLNVIYRPDRDFLSIEPFFFGPHPSAQGLLTYCDEEMLQITSTSPEVEKPNFVSNVRKSLNYMNGTTSSRVFTKTNEPMKFERVGLNGWVQIG